MRLTGCSGRETLAHGRIYGFLQGRGCREGEREWHIHRCAREGGNASHTVGTPQARGGKPADSSFARFGRARRPPLSPLDLHKLTIYGKTDRDWKLYTLDDKQTSLAEFDGKVVFVNFWATWCEACTIELPSIMRLQETVKDAPIEFVLITSEDRKVVTRYLQKKPMSLKILTSVKPPPASFTTLGLPATFVVSPQGLVVYRHFGLGKWDDPAAEKFLREVAHFRN
jgi:thiol-disulfide isomerase/thioredoxin